MHEKLGATAMVNARLGIVETFHETSLRGVRAHLPMFEVWMHGVVLCF